MVTNAVLLKRIEALKQGKRAQEPKSLEYFLIEDEDIILIEFEEGSSEETVRVCNQAHLWAAKFIVFREI